MLKTVNDWVMFVNKTHLFMFCFAPARPIFDEDHKLAVKTDFLYFSVQPSLNVMVSESTFS